MTIPTALLEALDRTVLLIRDEVRLGTALETIAHALLSTRVALVASERTLSSFPAQTAYVTTAILMARCGHDVHLVAPDVELMETNPVLSQGSLVQGLMDLGADMLPGVQFAVDSPKSVDFKVKFDADPDSIVAGRTVFLGADDWSGSLQPEPCSWSSGDWPMGALAAAALASGEAFKISMAALAPFATNPATFAKRFAPTPSKRFRLAPEETPKLRQLGHVDIISAGAITQSVFYCFSCIPDAKGMFRVIDAEYFELSNLNRYMLLRRSSVGKSKATHLSSILPGLNVASTVGRFTSKTDDWQGPLAKYVLVGVDHIPTRWIAQDAAPDWLGIGATTHWSSMASFHTPEVPCARCLHAADDDNNAPIPTVAFVSFWSGLLLATRFLRAVAGAKESPREQWTYLTTLRPEEVWTSPVQRRLGCGCHQDNPRANP